MSKEEINIETREYCRRACPEGRSSCELSHIFKIASTEVVCTSYGSPKEILMEKSISTLYNPCRLPRAHDEERAHEMIDSYIK
jgi:hypothetical protein